MKESVCLMNFSEITDPLECIEQMNSTIIEISHIKEYLDTHEKSSLIELMIKIRRNQLLVILILDTFTKKAAPIISPDLVFYIDGISSPEDLDYYLSTQTPIVMMVNKSNLNNALKIGKENNLIFLVDAEIPIREIEKYNIDKSKVFYRNLPLCIADDYQVYSTLSMLNTVSEVAQGNRVIPFNRYNEIYYYSKHKECLKCKQPCLGKRKGDSLYLIPTDTKDTLNYHSLMEEALCQRLPKVVKNEIDPHNLGWLLPLSETFKAYRIRGNFLGEDHCYISKLKDTLFYCRRDDLKEFDFEEKEGKVFWNCLYLNRRDPKMSFKLNYDIIVPKNSITVLMKLKSENRYSLKELKELNSLPMKALQKLIGDKSTIEERQGSIFVNNKKVMGREKITSNDGYIENLCIYSSLKDERENFNMMRNKGDFDLRGGISDIIPEISPDDILDEVYNTYSEFFKTHKNSLNNFRDKETQEKIEMKESAESLDLKGNIIEIGFPQYKLRNDSKTLDNRSSNNPDILGNFSSSFINNLPDDNTTFLMKGVWTPYELTSAGNMNIMETVFSKGCRFLIHFLHNKKDVSSYYMWSKSDDDLLDEIEEYKLSDIYDIVDMNNGFFEIRRKNV